MHYRKYFKERFIAHAFSTPFIWTPLPFFILLDIVVEIYQAICFPLYHLPKVKRSEYIQIIDRGKLQYLNPLEKIGCMYCGYANGLLLYIKEIAGRTESYWCGILHPEKAGFQIDPNHLENKFVSYGDEQAFQKKYPKNKHPKI